MAGSLAINGLELVGWIYLKLRISTTSAVTRPRAKASHLPSGAPVRINNATVSGKKLFVTGENFDASAVILLNGEEQKTRNDDQNPKTTVIDKKAGKKIQPGDKFQVRNPNGTLSQQFTFTGS